MAGHILIKAVPFAQSFGDLNTWPLSAVPMAPRTDPYFSFSVAARKTPSSPGFSRGWHFSCHTIKFGLNRGWADGPRWNYHHGPQLESLTSRLCYIFIKDWVSTALDVKVFPADCHAQLGFLLNTSALCCYVCFFFYLDSQLLFPA